MSLTCPHCHAALARRAHYCSHCGQSQVGEPEFRRWLTRVYRRQAIFCAVAIPVGLLFLTISPVTTVIVSGLGALGLIVSVWRLSRVSAA